MTPGSSLRKVENEQFLERAVRIASYYGFSAAEHSRAQGNRAHTAESRGMELALRPGLGNAVSAALARHLAEQRVEPAMLYHTLSSGTATLFSLDVIGINRSIAETLLIKTALAMYHEAGISDVRVYINSIGDRDSVNRFTRELQTFLNRHMSDLPPQGRDMLKRDVLAAFAFLGKKSHPLYEQAPKPMEFLSDASRRQLREMLEFLEAAEIPYEVDNEVSAGQLCYSQTVFEIREHHSDEEESPNALPHQTPLARGGRYDDFLRRTMHAPLAAVRLTLAVKKHGELTSAAKPAVRKPKIYFIQLGTDARIRALSIIELLRKARVPLIQSLGMETLASQLSIAERLAIPYAIIMGQKEVVENTVIVRNLSSRRQDTIAIGILPAYIKRMRL